MERVEVRHRGELPTSVQVHSPRLDELRQTVAEHERGIRELEEQVQKLTFEIQRQDQEGNHSLETSQRRATIRQQLRIFERQLADHQSIRNRIKNERDQWVEEIAIRQYRRRLLWQEMAEARPGPVSDWSYTRMYAIGQREERTTGDVKRDLLDCLGWLLNFSGQDEEIQRELAQLNKI